MKKILLVIFFFAIILSIIIYKLNVKENNNLLVLGDNYLLYKKNSYIDKIDDKYKISAFTYDNITYKELINCIKSNDYIIVKNKKIYLNQLIASANIIIINANNKEYDNKCKKNKRIQEQYNIQLEKEMNNLSNIIKKISSAKVIIIKNSCNEKDNINNDIVNLLDNT